MSLTLTSGDTVTLKAALLDGETGQAIDSALVSNVWVQIGADYSKALSDSAVSVEDDPSGDYISVTLSTADTDDFANQQSVRTYIKVRLTDGRVTTIVNGELLIFETNPLTETY